MSSKYQVRKIAGIREALRGLQRALEKMENPPIGPDDPPRIAIETYGSIYDKWFHPAAKVIEEGYFCPKCGKQVASWWDDGKPRLMHVWCSSGFDSPIYFSRS
jgi:hypothetical protein